MQEQELYINGTRIYSLTNHDLHSFCLSLYIRAGSIFEDITENGISHLFEHTVFRNLKNKYENFYHVMAKRGIDFGGCTYKEFIKFTVTGPSYEFDFASDILCGVFDEIVLDPCAFASEKKRIKAEMRERDERNSLHYLFNKAVWHDTEAEKTILGYCSVIDRISLRKLNEFGRKILSRDNCFLYVTGNASDEDIGRLGRKVEALDISQTSSGLANTITLNRDFFHRDGNIKVKNGYWHYIKVGFDIDRKKYFGGIPDLLYDVLFIGEKSLVYEYLSENNPIIYSYDSTLEQYDNVGNMNYNFEVDSDKLNDAVGAIVELLGAVKIGRFDYESSLLSKLHCDELEWDNPENLNFSLAYYNHILDTVPYDRSDKYYGRYNVTKDEVVAAARDIFRPENMTVSVKGNKRKVDVGAIEEIMKTL